jgi:hypothetical protein
VVGDRPRVFRTFLDDVGTRAIAVGTPSGVHFAFDAATSRLVMAWRGAFLDGSGAWSGRGGNSTGPRGVPLWSAPEGPAIVFGDVPEVWPTVEASRAKTKFLGYRIDDRGDPTFVYEIGKVRVEERPGARVAGTMTLIRRFEVHTAPCVLNAGKGRSRIVDIRDGLIDRLERPDGEVWYLIQHESTRLKREATADTVLGPAFHMGFTLEIEP